VGTWSKGLREGDGKLLWSTGAWYQGQFQKDQLHGKGTLQKDHWSCLVFVAKFIGSVSFLWQKFTNMTGTYSLGSLVKKPLYRTLIPQYWFNKTKQHTHTPFRDLFVLSFDFNVSCFSC